MRNFRGSRMRMKTLTHGSLFSGIGGFDLAARWAGIENIFQVEIDKYCLGKLEKNFPEAHRYTDIKDFNGTAYRGRIDIISGGFPCQPFSIAGQRKGTEDDRWLWSEMLRVISEIQPSWVIAENVYGFVDWDDGVVLEQVCSEMEGLGYEVQPFIIPASAVNAPHRRYRVWIVANNDSASTKHEVSTRRDVFGSETNHAPHTTSRQSGEPSKWEGWKNLSGRDYESGKTDHAPHTDNQRQLQQLQTSKIQNDIANTHGKGLQGSYEGTYRVGEGKWLHGCYDFNNDWLEVATALCGMDDGLPDRVARLKALGNAIVPQVAYEIFKAIIETEKQQKAG